MPYVRNSYIGWSEEWFDKGDPKVDEVFIKFFVNRYFDFPEDVDEDDVPLIMVWIRCVTCGCVHEHFMKETEESYQDFLYNKDNTHTSLSRPECETCSGPRLYSPNLQDERSKMIEEFYEDLLIYGGERKILFESPMEEYFWKAWRTTFHNINLIPQYRIGNYRVDFAHIPTKTVIEIDGRPFHSTLDKIAKDEIRQAIIEKQGWNFIRFKGSDVNYHVDKCVVMTAFFLSKINSIFIDYARFEWRSSPSARLLTRLQESYGSNFIGDVP